MNHRIQHFGGVGGLFVGFDVRLYAEHPIWSSHHFRQYHHLCLAKGNKSPYIQV